ncbi:hypothetical protein WICMUC_005056 [Wickerhamomyces mucosus]|uniref:GATA-type domain-containing protein n=1 Tax=Wickerhamomyces mucosus TaxID=1378264 RepID=A0A9P8PBS8_9ASCO|nr:hypothetical protein WICMUC_005056 [Wickerhamomyces mucosus]
MNPRLPSFNEFTSIFNNPGHGSQSSRESSTISRDNINISTHQQSAPSIQSRHDFSNPQQIPPLKHNSGPIIPPPQIPLPNQIQQTPGLRSTNQLPHSSIPNISIQGQLSTDNQHRYRTPLPHFSIPTSYPGTSSGSSNDPLPKIVDSNYIVDNRNQNDLSNRRLSLPVPASRHSKKDSYDSQTLLSQFVDIASQKSADEIGAQNNSFDEINLLKDLSITLQDFVKLNQIVNDIKTDFQFKLRDSENCEVSKRLPIDSTRYISHENFHSFISNIPIPALYDSISISSNIQIFFENWLKLRREEEHKKFEQRQQEENQRFQLQLQQQQQQLQKRKQKQQKQQQQQEKQNRRQQRLQQQQQVQQEKGNLQENSLRRERNEFEMTQDDDNQKKRKHSRISIKSLSLPDKSLNVPAQSLNIEIPSAKSSVSSKDSKVGAFIEDLSMKEDHKCQQCGSDDTPEWRRGPYGSRSLCNACGLFYGKLIKKFGYDEAAELMLKRRESGNGDDRRIPID